MRGKLHLAPPPGYLTSSQAAQRLGRFRQQFHQAGLADALERWQVGPGRGTLLYRREDVDGLAHWLFVREGLVALELRPANCPLNPDDGEYYAAAEEGYWDTACPHCGHNAVGEPLRERTWCPECGVVNE